MNCRLCDKQLQKGPHGFEKCPCGFRCGRCEKLFHGLAALTSHRQCAHLEEYRVAGTPQSKRRWVTPEKLAVAHKSARMQAGATPIFKKVSDQDAVLG